MAIVESNSVAAEVPAVAGRLTTSQADLSESMSVAALAGMTLLAAAAMAGTLPGRTHGLGLITEGLLASFELSRSDYARINLVATLMGSLFCWPCGWLLDRLGLRWTGAAVMVLLGFSALGIASTRHVALLWVWITLTRGFGQSMLSVVSLTLIGKSSVGRHHPAAMAGYSILVSLLFIAIYSFMERAVPAAGWQAAWSRLAWTLILAGPVLGFLVIEVRRPAATQCLPEEDGSSATVRQALGSPSFWILALTSSLYLLVSSGLSLFNQSILQEREFDAQVFYRLVKISTFAGMVSNLAAGYLARFISYSRLMAIAMTAYMVALLAFPLVTTKSQVYAYGICLGLCGGIVTVVFFGVWSYAYGREHLGKIQGIAQAATVVCSAVGPLVFAECRQQFGSYSPAFWTLAPCIGCLAIAAWVWPTPRAAPGRWPRSLTSGSASMIQSAQQPSAPHPGRDS